MRQTLRTAGLGLIAILVLPMGGCRPLMLGTLPVRPAFPSPQAGSQLIRERDRAVRASRALASGMDQDELCDAHNKAVARCLQLAGSHQREAPWIENLAQVGIVVASTSPGLDPGALEAVRLADDRIVLGTLPRIRNKGLGVPLVVQRRFERHAHVRPVHTRQAYFAATAVLEPPVTPEAPATLVLHDPLAERTAKPGNLPLAAELTIPLVQELSHGGRFARYEYVGLLQPEFLHERKGIYLVDPYCPGRVPVLIVHGLWSSPKVWITLLNTLRADPVLRERCQFWVVLYPTGYPLPESAAMLRQAIHDVRTSLDPTGTDPALDQLVVIGKSTGGNVVKMLAQASGSGLWDTVFTRPPDQIEATPEVRAWLNETFFFQPEPAVRRLIFIATPHRGSKLARQRGGKIASGALRLGDPMRSAHAAILAANGPGAFRAPYDERPPNTIDNLEESSPILAALDRAPIDPSVPYHSIIGAVQREAPLEKLSDGIVGYPSAHIGGAVSERLVQTDHFCEAHPEVIAEVRRILFEHLATLGLDRR